MDRSGFIGGSDIGVILGLSEYRTAYDLWLQKTGKQTSDSGSMATQAGHALEPMILQAYADETGRTLEYQHRMQREDLPWAAGTADAVCWEDDIVIDAKASCSFSAWGHGPPPTVYAQMQWYMWLLGFQRADIALLLASAGWSYTSHTILRNDTFIEIAVEKATRFWEQVQSDTPPEPQTYGDVMRIFAVPEKSSVAATKDMIDKVERWREVQGTLKDLDAEKLALRKDIALFMKDAELLAGPEGETLVRTVHGRFGRQLRLR